MVNQLNIYSVLGCANDPVFIELSKLENSSVVKVQFKDITVSKNAAGLFEIVGTDCHDCASDLEDCYSKIVEFTKPSNVI